MTLLEMSVQYAERAAAIRERITMLRGMERQESDLETARSLRRRVAELLPLWREARDLARLTAHYYDREAASGWPTLPAGSGRAPRTTGNSWNACTETCAWPGSRR